MEYELVKEFLKGTTGLKVMDVNENSVEVTNCNNNDLDDMERAGLEVSEIESNNFKIVVEDKEKFVESYNEWIENTKKISTSEL